MALGFARLADEVGGTSTLHLEDRPMAWTLNNHSNSATHRSWGKAMLCPKLEPYCALGDFV